MKQLDPNQIPETISLVASIFSEKRNPTKEEFLKLDNFFKIYMGKAIEDCQKQSAALWSPLKPKSELNFSSKEVVIDPKDQEQGTIKFVVATTRSVVFNEEDRNIFQAKTQEKMIQEFEQSDTNTFVVVFNKLVFGKDINGDSKFFNSLFMAILFSKEFFVQE